MELGSEYNLSVSELYIKQDNIFSYLSEYSQIELFDSGRSALRCLAGKLKQDSEVLFPEFICESVIRSFSGLNHSFYKLQEDFSPDVNDLKAKIKKNTSAIFMMHYFGSVQPAGVLTEIRKIADDAGCTIIEDTTQSIFSNKQTIGDYMVCSIRKWMPLPQGGLLYSQDKENYSAYENYKKSEENDRLYGMILKTLFLQGKVDCNQEYREIFAESEERLDSKTEICRMSDLSEFLVSCVSTDRLRNKRKENYVYLKTSLEEMGIKPAIGLNITDTPFAFPLRIKDRDVFRAYLMDNRIYCAVHWPFDQIHPEYRPFAVRNAAELISLPVDQRYERVDMDYLIHVVRQYGGDLLY